MRQIPIVLPLEQHLKAQGMSLREIATEMNNHSIKPARDDVWYASSVRNVLSRENRAVS